MKDNELYYYKCGIGIGSCDKAGKERINNFLNHLEDDNHLKKKTKWISKREYVIRLRISGILSLLIFPIYLLSYGLSKIFTYVSKKCYNFICDITNN